MKRTARCIPGYMVFLGRTFGKHHIGKPQQLLFAQAGGKHSSFTSCCTHNRAIVAGLATYMLTIYYDGRRIFKQALAACNDADDLASRQ
jgi:hypothetical protein